MIIVLNKFDFLTISLRNWTKKCLRLNDIFTILAHDNVFIRILFWNTTKPLHVTPISNSLSEES
jgi:hypothetical protein